MIPKSKGWRVPAYGGVCGRLEIVAFEGEPLSSLLHVEYYRKLKYARAILEAAMDFTFKHDRSVHIYVSCLLALFFVSFFGNEHVSSFTDSAFTSWTGL